MKHLLIAASLFLGLSQGIFAQATPPQPKPRTPFAGSIGYQLKYTGYPKELSAHLPDSMTLWASAPLIRVQYHGGLADTLQTELHWDASQHVYYMIDHVAQKAWTVDEPYHVAPKLPLKSVAADSLAGLRCKVYEVPVQGGKDRYSISDSLFFPFQLADSLRDSLSHLVPPFLLPGQQSLPLRIVRTTAQGTVETKAVTVNSHVPEPTVFRMPSGYDIKEFDPRPRFHPLVRKPE